MLIAGCSFLRTDVTSCEVNADCRNRFGLGSTCADDGFCTEQIREERCSTTFPAQAGGLFALQSPEELEQLENTVVFGSIMQREVGLFAAIEDSYRLAVKQAEEQGGAGTKNFGIVFCDISSTIDDGRDPADAALFVADYLANVVDVPAIFGPATSGDTQAVFQELSNENAGVVLISPSATSDALTALDPATVDDDNPGLLWRTAPPDSLQSRAIAFDMREPGPGRECTPTPCVASVSSVAVINQVGPYGEGLASVFIDEFNARGGSSQEFTFDTTGERDSFITQAGGSFEEVLFVSSDVDDVNAFLNIAGQDINYDGMGIFLTDAAANNSVIGVGSSARYPQVRGTRPKPLDSTDRVYQIFLNSFFAEYGVSADGQVFTANAYDAGWLMVYGTAWAEANEGGVINGQNLAKGLRRLSSGNDVDIGPTEFNMVKQAFDAGTSVNVTGASGRLDYDPTTEETSSDVDVWSIEGTTIVSEYTFTQ